MRKSSELVSVIIPTFNRADVICNAVDSVLSQTYAPVELIVVDDGSTDNTPDLLRQYGADVHYIRKPNGGVADARNVGFQHAKGAYIAYLDSDDCWLPEKLDRFLDRLDGNTEKPALLFSDHRRIARDGSESLHSDFYSAARQYFLQTKRMVDTADKLRLIFEPYTFYPSTFLLTRAAHDKLSWRLFPRVNEDLFFTLEAARLCDFIYIDEPLTTYHVRDDSISASVATSHKWSEYAFEIIDLFRKEHSLSPTEQALCSQMLSKLSVSLLKQSNHRVMSAQRFRYLFHAFCNRHTYQRAFAKLQFRQS